MISSTGLHFIKLIAFFLYRHHCGMAFRKGIPNRQFCPLRRSGYNVVSLVHSMKSLPTNIGFMRDMFASTSWCQALITIIANNQCNTLFLGHWNYSDLACQFRLNFRVLGESIKCSHNLFQYCTTVYWITFCSHICWIKSFSGRKSHLY